MTKPLVLEKVLWIKKDEGIAASGVIPTDAEFFQDHFPGFPVLPGVLALEMLKQSAEAYLKKYSDEKSVFQLQTLKNVKFSHYLKPGDPWESNLELVETKDNVTVWKARLSSQGKLAVTARLLIRQTVRKHLVLLETS